MKKIHEIVPTLLIQDGTALQNRLNTLGAARAVLQSTPPDQIIYEVVRPCSDPSHAEARIRKAGDLKALLQECLDLWNSRNNTDNQATKLEYCYVFVILGESRVSIPGAEVEALTGVKTQDFTHEDRIRFNIGPEETKGWI